MPRPSRGVETFAGAGRIRKRGCSSSSSSSSVLQHCRLKRAVLVAKRGGASTPAPAWKTEAGFSPSSASDVTRCQRQAPSISGRSRGEKQQQGPVSARKLASALWELHGVPSPTALVGRRRRKDDAGGRDYVTKWPCCLSDPSYSPCSQVAGRSVSRLHRRMGSSVSQKCSLRGNHNSSLDSFSNGSSIEIENRSRNGVAPLFSVGKTQNCLKDLRNGLYASKELLKTVKRFLQIEDRHSATITPIISALQVELERAHLQVNYLTESLADFDAGRLQQRFVEDNSIWKRKMQERVKYVVHPVMEELEIEKKLRRRTDRLNEKLMMELTEAKASLARASEEYENERRQRELIEQVCDELVKGIGEDRAEMEKMKEESAKVREELEKEREMLHLADVWREERVQMKLSEAKYHLEEKNAAVDQLRRELETYLANRKCKDDSTGYAGAQDDMIEEEGPEHPDGTSCLAAKRSVGESEESNNLEKAEASSVGDGELDSEDCDLHSIELSVDNFSKSYKWNFTTGDEQLDWELSPYGSNSKARSSSLEKPTSRFPYEADAVGCSRWSFDVRGLPDFCNGLGLRGLDNSNTREEDGKFHDQDVQRYKSVKGLRDQMLSACKVAQSRGLASPTRMCMPQPRRTVDCGDHVLVGSQISKTGNVASERGLKDAGLCDDRERSCSLASKT